MARHSSKPLIRACVLAAGTSTRFGDTKLVQNFRGKPLLQHALLAAAGACAGAVTLVVGHDDKAVVAAAAGLANNIVLNDAHRLGIGSSIAAGVRAIQDDADAILIVLADAPLVTSAHLNALIDTWSGADTEIVASKFDGIFSPPILFPEKTFGALAALSGDNGAKAVLANAEFDVYSIALEAASLDVDTPEDLKKLERD